MNEEEMIKIAESILAGKIETPPQAHGSHHLCQRYIESIITLKFILEALKKQEHKLHGENYESVHSFVTVIEKTILLLHDLHEEHHSKEA